MSDSRLGCLDSFARSLIISIYYIDNNICSLLAVKKNNYSFSAQTECLFFT